VIGSRSRSRQLALQALYSYDQDPERRRSTMAGTLKDAEASSEVRAFAAELADGVLERMGEIDALIAKTADNWDMKRLASIDRNVLRLAIHEMLDRDDIPTAVTIDEAIELSKRFSTAQSGAFVNGILDRIRRDLGLVTSDDDTPPVAFTPPPTASGDQGAITFNPAEPN
jgi:N utilization substance protein B